MQGNMEALTKCNLSNVTSQAFLLKNRVEKKLTFKSLHIKWQIQLLK
jgi:hypothetical protein